MENQKISIQDRLDSTYKTDIDYKNKQIQELRDNEKELRKWLHTIKDEQILKIQELNNTHNKDVKEIHNKYQYFYLNILDQFYLELHDLI